MSPDSGSAPDLSETLRALGDLESPADVTKALKQLDAGGVLHLPLPGRGQTRRRFAALSEIGAVDLSLARLAEGHTDAIAILSEAGVGARRGTYGVWAAEPPEARVEAIPSSRGWTLTGMKKYGSGATGLDRALVTAHTSEGPRLFDVDLRDPRIRPEIGTWNAIGMALTDSIDVSFEDAHVTPQAAIGGPGFYTSRAGFWHGAVGVAACWYGGAHGALRMLRARLATKANDHQAAHLGAVAAACTAMNATLEAAARAIDVDPDDRTKCAQSRALVVRHVVEQACQDVLARVGRATGSSALVFDRAHARRAADLVVYLRQHRAEQDLTELGRSMLAVAT
ncbi:acyl-CoA dehydrogenase family protein [soil metagenome]